MLNFSDVEEVMMEEKEYVSNGAEFKENFERFGVDFDDIGSAVKSMMGKRDGAIWIVGFYTALLLASKHWEYRTPPEE